MRGLSARFTDCPPTMPPTVEEVGSAEASTPQAWPKTTAESPSSTQNQILLRRNITAEMATVLRKQAPILIRLREKLGLQCLTDKGGGWANNFQESSLPFAVWTRLPGPCNGLTSGGRSLLHSWLCSQLCSQLCSWLCSWLFAESPMDAPDFHARELLCDLAVGH